MSSAVPLRMAEALGWLALAGLLVVVVPLYLSMPLNFDIFFYDACGQVVLRGGALQKEMFFMPPPGMAWSLALERAALPADREPLARQHGCQSRQPLAVARVRLRQGGSTTLVASLADVLHGLRGALGFRLRAGMVGKSLPVRAAHRGARLKAGGAPSTGLLIVTFGGVSFTPTIVVVCADKPPLSVTVNVTTNFIGTPSGAENVCNGFASVLTGEPSPKFHE